MADKTAEREKAVKELSEKIIKNMLDAVYKPDGTARPRHEVEKILRARGKK